MPSKIGTFLIGLSNVIGCSLSFIVASYLGRRRIFIISYGAMTICVIINILAIYFDAQIMLLVSLVLFQIVYQMGVGAISGVYLTEICNDTGVSIGSFVLWLCVAFNAAALSYMLGNPSFGNKGTFLFLGVMNILAFLFSVVFVKETKGFTDDHNKRLYYHE